MNRDLRMMDITTECRLSNFDKFVPMVGLYHLYFLSMLVYVVHE